MKIKNVFLLSLSFVYAAEPAQSTATADQPLVIKPQAGAAAASAEAPAASVVVRSEVSAQFTEYVNHLCAQLNGAYLVHITDILTIRDGQLVILPCGIDGQRKSFPRALVHFSVNSISRDQGKHAILIPFRLFSTEALQNLYSFHPEDTTFKGPVLVPQGSTVLSIGTLSEARKAALKNYTLVEGRGENVVSVVQKRLSQLGVNQPKILSDSSRTKKVFPLSPVGSALLTKFISNPGLDYFFSLFPSPFDSFVGHPDDNAPLASVKAFIPKILKLPDYNTSLKPACPPFIRDLTIMSLFEIWQDPISQHFLSQLLKMAEQYDIPDLKDCKDLTETLVFYKNMQPSRFDDRLLTPNHPEYPSYLDLSDEVQEWAKGIDSICSRSDIGFNLFITQAITIAGTPYVFPPQYKRAMTFIHQKIELQRIRMRLQLRTTLKLNPLETDNCLVAHLNGKDHVPMTQEKLERKLAQYQAVMDPLSISEPLTGGEQLFFHCIGDLVP